MLAPENVRVAGRCGWRCRPPGPAGVRKLGLFDNHCSGHAAVCVPKCAQSLGGRRKDAVTPTRGFHRGLPDGHATRWALSDFVG